MIRLELTMGRHIPGEGQVNDAMMDSFIQSEIMPRFEFGTLLDGHGIWKGHIELVKIFYVQVSDAELEEHKRLLRLVATAYKTQFRQDSVMISELRSTTICS